MIFKTSWSSIHLFGQGYMFSFAYNLNLDFSFNWAKDWQQSDVSSKVFIINEWRGRCWKNNLWYTKLIVDALNHIVPLGLAVEVWVPYLLDRFILRHYSMFMYIGVAAFVEVRAAIIGGLVYNKLFSNLLNMKFMGQNSFFLGENWRAYFFILFSDKNQITVVSFSV